MKDLLSSKKAMWVMGYIGLYLIATGVSWATFTFLGGSGGSLSQSLSRLASKRAQIKAELPKTEECPLNGGMFTKVEREIWEERRPLTVVIENHQEARPLEGLSRADIVYEAVAEGGVTRNLAVLYCGVAADDVRIAPIRSARVHLVNWAAGYNNPIFMHIGGANDFCQECPGGVKYKGQVDPRVNAYNLLSDLGWLNGAKGNDFDAERNVGYPVVGRDPDRLGSGKQLATEHTVFGFTDKIFDEAAKRGFTSDGWEEEFKPWKFKDGKVNAAGGASNISFEFWSNKPEYDVEWKFDAATNSYARFNGGERVVDLSNNKKEVNVSNVVVMFIEEEGPVDKELHIYYEAVGEGEALIFQNGEVVESTWEKEDITSPIIFSNSEGEEIEFVRGPIWIEGVPKGNDIVYN